MATRQFEPEDLHELLQQFEGMEVYHLPLTPHDIDVLKEALENLRKRQTPMIPVRAEGQRDIIVALVLAGTNAQQLLERADFSDRAADN